MYSEHTVITRSLFQTLLSQGSKLLLKNLETLTKIHKRIATGKMNIEKVRETFALSKLLNNFEKQIDFNEQFTSEPNSGLVIRYPVSIKL